MTFLVAHINVARGFRGGERQTELLIRELHARGIRQRLIARRGGALAQRLAGLGIGIREVSGQLPGVVAASAGVDVIHVHEGRSVYGAWLRHLLSGTPYILTRRVDNPIGAHRLAHHAYRRAAFVVAISPQVADVVQAFEPGVRLRVIESASSGLAVDAAEAAAIRSRLGAGMIIGHVGALDNAQKAQEHIITVAGNLRDSHPELRFVLVGGGDDEAMLKKAAAGLDNLVFTGFVDNVGDYLAAFDIFVLPSRREGLGSILLDAMAQGLPIVAARVGGVPRIVIDRENGLLIDSERPDQLQAGILELAASPELRERMGARGREMARNYTAPVMAEKYLDLYRSAIA
jgi:glycosyltransferase involved in cell wall biosynthesis